MSVVKHFIEDSIKRTEIDEFLRNEFERAGYGGVSITKTPLGTHLVIYTMRPGLVIGRGGETIRALATVLEEKFQLPSPQISVAEIEVPELNAHVVASKIASALKRGVHYRRAGFWGLTQAMEAGALGIEIIISGKLRTDRARYEKFCTGYLPKSGEPPRKYMRKAELHVQMKPGMLGVKVQLMPPDAQFPDQEKVQVFEKELASEPAREVVTEKVDAEEAVSEPAVSPVEEKVAPEEKAVEPEVPAVKEKEVAEAKDVSAETKAVTEEKVAAPAVSTVDEKVATEKKVVTEKVVPVAEKKVVAAEKVVKQAVPVVTKKPVEAKKVEKVAEPAVSPVKETKVAEAKVPVVAKKPAEEKKVAPKAAKPEAVPVEKKAVTEKKAAEPEFAPAKEKKTTSTKKVAKAEVSSAKEKDEAGK